MNFRKKKINTDISILTDILIAYLERIESKLDAIQEVIGSGGSMVLAERRGNEKFLLTFDTEEGVKAFTEGRCVDDCSVFEVDEIDIQTLLNFSLVK